MAGNDKRGLMLGLGLPGIRKTGDSGRSARIDDNKHGLRNGGGRWAIAIGYSA